MNTPAHAVLNLLLLGRRGNADHLPPIVLGAVLPDLPAMLFYACEKLVRGTPESVIWSQAYHHPGWQMAFDLVHSLPLHALGAIVARRAGARRATLLFLSMVLHAVADLALHHDDAHRHLYPFSDWRFRSPVSYWDPAHYGLYVAPLEGLLVIAGCIVLMRRLRGAGPRLAVGVLGAVYLAYLGYVFLTWA